MNPVNPSSRLGGLNPATAQHVIAAAQALDAGRADAAADHLHAAYASNPDHPEILRLLAGLHSLRGEHEPAQLAIRDAVDLRPLDPLYHNTMGMVLATAGDHDGAAASFRRACELKPDLASAWYNLGILLVRSMRNDEAAEALRKALALDPGNIGARAQLADLLRASNHADEAAAEYRRIIASRPWTGMAWWGLADLKNLKFSESDVGQLQAAATDTRASDDDLIATGFALARALDDQGRYAEALAAIERADEIARRRVKWDAAAFSRDVDAIDRVFSPPPSPAPQAQGDGVVFVVSLPRSGSTLIEQILASHPSVEGAGELPDLPLVLSEESRRRGQPLQDWAGSMRPEDWQQLGQRYLDRTAHWTRQRPVFIDKLPSNWQFVGAIRAMLPAARIVVARRNPLETCFSCYRQLLVNNEYTRTFADLASYWRDFDHSMRGALEQHASHVFECVYEDLVADPEHSIRRLLDFCGLPFDPACLEFHRTEREVRSPSAMQVREPLRSDTMHSQRYGALLNPLRAELGLPAL